MKSLLELTDTYRVILTRRNASEILVLPNGPGSALPRLEIHRHQRVAEQLTKKVESAWNVEAYCLLAPVLGTYCRDEDAKCAVMETVRQDEVAPTRTYWIRRVEAADRVETSELILIRKSFEELDTYAAHKKAGPFARCGWLK